jgi:effector-binding domain-containing protein
VVGGRVGRIAFDTRYPEQTSRRPGRRTLSDELFAKGRGAATIYIPCDAPIEGIGRVRPHHSPEVEVATIVHAGSHRSIDIAYGALATHVARHKLAADGPLREH